MEPLNNHEILYDYLKRLIGKPYFWAGDDPIKGFDCSGFVIELLQAIGVLPHKFDTTSEGLRIHPKMFPFHKGEFGVLAFYGVDGKANHVSFCLNHHLMVEAGGGDSSTNNLEVASNKNAFIRIRPILYRKDFLEFKKPVYPF